MNSNKYDARKSAFIDPADKLWLEIVLYSFLLLEVLYVIVLIVILFLGEVVYFLIGIPAILIIHLMVMLSLNKAFNIQIIKDEIEDIKKIISIKK